VDESIVPRKKLAETEEIQGPPLVPTGTPLAAVPEFARGGIVSSGRHLVCAVCGLDAGTCGHQPNLVTEAGQ
jgi:hypothetical protein